MCAYRVPGTVIEVYVYKFIFFPPQPYEVKYFPILILQIKKMRQRKIKVKQEVRGGTGFQTQTVRLQASFLTTKTYILPQP